MADAARDAEQFLADARCGSVDALGRALETCRAYLLLVAEQEIDSKLKPKGGASDIVQQTFLEAQQAFNRFQGTSDGELRAWLRKMLLNNVANFRRHYQQTAKRTANREVALGGHDSSRFDGSWLADSGLTPSRKMEQGEYHDALGVALERLPPDYQEVLILRYREELAFEEIAERMGRTSPAVRKLWSRAIERLQLEMDAAP